MKICSFNATADYHTFTVFDPSVIGDDRGNEVTDAYIKQGFSWRRGNVDFYTLDDLGMSGEVFLEENVQLSPDALYAIQVPFIVEGTSGVGISASPLLVEANDVAGITPFKRDSNKPPYDYYSYAYLPIPPGEYALVFEQGFIPDWDRTGYYGKNVDEKNTISTWGHLWFNLEVNAEPRILRPGSRKLKLCDPYLNPPLPLRMDARPLSEQ